MNRNAAYLLRNWVASPITRRHLFIAATLTAFSHTSLGRAFGITTPAITQILGRPTNNSVAISVLSDEPVSAYIQYGTSKNRYSGKSAEQQTFTNSPTVFEIENLPSSTKIYYRVNFRKSSDSTFIQGKQYSFVTSRKTGSSFSFTLHGDTHPERAGKMFNAELYQVMLSNVAQQQPDFHIMMGDDFSIDPLIGKGQANQENVEKIYSTQRKWLTIAGSSVPLYLVNGNHEQAAAYLLDGTSTSPAVLAGNARLKYFPLPSPNKFYSGDLEVIPGVGQPRDYYSWTWGDALFITLDPYWHSSNPVDNVAGLEDPNGAKNGGNKNPGGKNAASPVATPIASPLSQVGNGKTTNLWSIGLGDVQYNWLKKTLETSSARFKFVFAHHVMGTGRGGVEVSTDYEWGGRDPKGKSSFKIERPNWELPIHDLMVKNKVSIFFQGHDHIFCTQERDGLIYQSMPNPADDTFSMFNEDAYKSGVKAPNSGHVRVTVSTTQAKVEYFLAARPQDSARKNLALAHSYIVKPKG